jgi:hypothetical protein
MRNYSSITSRLMGDDSLTLELERLDWQYGVHRIRQAAIWGKNPDAGKTAGEGDQEYILGPRDTQRGLEFRGRETIEALNLLERACTGETGLKDTVTRYSHNDKEVIHGNEVATPGLDQWIFNHATLMVQNKAGILTANMTVYNLLIASQKIANVGEVISLYESNIQKDSEIEYISTGAYIRRYLLENAGLKSKNSDFRDTEGITHEVLLNNFHISLSHFAPIGISQDAKEALLTKMLLDFIYK